MRENRICLIHGTADRLLETRAAYGAELEPASLQARDFTPHVDVMRERVNELFGEEVDLVNVLVGVGKDYRDGSDVACHRFYGELPSGSILYAEEGIYVASPYLNLLLEARDLHLVNLCSMLGRYLGTFSTTASGGSSDEIVSRAPLVREPELSRYLSCFKTQQERETSARHCGLPARTLPHHRRSTCSWLCACRPLATASHSGSPS